MRRLGRILGWTCVVLVALAVAVASALQLPPVRLWIRDRIVESVQGSLRGTLHVRDVRWPSPAYLVLSDVSLSDRHGTRVAGFSTLVVRLRLASLFARQVEVERIELSDLYLDFAELGEESGLLSVFASDAPPPPKPVQGPMSPLPIVVRQLCLVHSEVRALLSSDRALSVRRLDACVRLRVEQSLELALEKLTASAFLNDTPLLSLLDQPSLPALGVGNDTDGLRAALVGRLRFASADDMAFDMRLFARGFSPATLRALGQAQDVLRRPLDLDVRAVQAAGMLRFRAQLASAAGALAAHGSWSAQRELQLRLESAALSLAEVADVPLDTLGFALDARARLPDTAPLQLELALEHGYYGRWPLPWVSLSGTRSEAGVIALRALEAKYAHSVLRGSAELKPDGALQAQAQLAVPELAEIPPLRSAQPSLHGSVRASLALRRGADQLLDAHTEADVMQLSHERGRIGQLRLVAELAGSLDQPSLRVDVRGTDLASAERAIGAASLLLTGGPKHYEFAVEAEHDWLRADGWAEHAASGWLAGLSLTSVLPQGVLSVSAPKLHFVPAQSLELTQLRASFHDASLLLDGKLNLQRSDNHLRAAATVPDIERVAKALGTRGIPGRVELVGSLKGSLERPQARLKLRYGHGLQFDGAPASLGLDLNADAAAGRSELQLQARAGRARITGKLDTRWPRRAPLSAVVQRARHELALELHSVSLPALLSPGEPEPGRMLDGFVDGTVSAEGNQERFSFDTHFASRLRAARDQRSVDVTLDASYRDARVALSATAADRRGKLLDLQASAQLQLERQLRQPEALEQLLTRMRWQLASELTERSLAELPMLQSLGVEKRWLAARASLHAQVKHEPHAQPVGDLDAQLHFQPAPQRSAGTKPGARGEPAGPASTVTAGRRSALAATPGPAAASCSERATGHVHLIGKWADRKLGLELLAGTSKGDDVRVTADMPLPFERLLSGADARASFDGVRFAAQVHELDLQRVPWLCEGAAGRVSLTANLAEPLTPRADLALQIDANGVRWQDGPSVHWQLEARSLAEWVRVSAQLESGGGALHMTARLPVDVRADNPAALVRRADPIELDVGLERVPMAALLAFAPGVARVSGTGSGQLKLRGTVDAPDARGALSFEDVSLTLPRLGQRFSHVFVKAMLDGQTLRLSEGRVRDLTGSASLAALVTVRALDAWRAELNVNARNFPMRKSGVIMGHADANVRVVADMTKERAQAEVSLEGVSIDLTSEGFGDVQSLEAHPEFDFVDARSSLHKRREQGEAGDAEITPTTIHVATKEPLWVRRDDFAAQMETELTLTLAGATPLLKGRIKLIRGYISLLGQNFDIKRGEVVLAGGEQVDPQLDITAEHVSPRGARVRLQVKGFVNAPQLSFFIDGSDQPVTAGEALLAINSRGSGGGGASAEEQVTSAAIGMTTGLLSLGARREFGDWIPMLQIEPGDQTRVRVGLEADRLIPNFMKGFVRGAYVEGIVTQGSTSQSGGQSTSTTNTTSGNGVLLELMLPSDLVWAGQYGPGTAWSVDLDWRP